MGPKDEVYQEWNATPSRIALYAQDKIEYEGMIANIGLRLDMFNSNGQVIEPDDQFSDIFDENAWDEEFEKVFGLFESLHIVGGDGVFGECQYAKSFGVYVSTFSDWFSVACELVEHSAVGIEGVFFHEFDAMLGGF